MLKLRERLTSLKLPYKVVSLKTLKNWSKEFNWQKRSLKKLCQEYAKDMPKLITLKRWSKVFNWQKRSCHLVGQKLSISNCTELPSSCHKMIETLRNKEIFELYFSIGSKRSLEKLLDKLHQNSTETAPSLRTLKSWSKAFNWQKRIEQRDIEIENKLEKREVVNWLAMSLQFQEVVNRI